MAYFYIHSRKRKERKRAKERKEKEVLLRMVLNKKHIILIYNCITFLFRMIINSNLE